MDEVKISVIMPVFNSENTLGRAAESVLAQVETEFELIIVNDGSTDKSENVARHYAEIDSRIKLITQANGGPLAAIRTGMQLAKGNFVAFLDADDEYHKNYLSELYRVTTEYDADIAVCGFYHRTGDETVERKMCQGGKVYERKEIQECLVGRFLSERILMGARWNKLFKRACIENALNNITSDFNYGEDVVMVLGAFFEASKIVVSEACLYYYYDTEQSLEKRMSGLDQRMTSAEIMYKNEIDVLGNYKRMDLLPYAAYYHYREILAHFKELSKEMKSHNECMTRMKAVLKNRATCHALKYAPKENRKSRVVIWLMKRRRVLLLRILLKNAN